jgi:hypothetical protein
MEREKMVIKTTDDTNLGLQETQLPDMVPVGVINYS